MVCILWGKSRNLHDCKLVFYSHITSHVSQAFASCTHYISYFAKLGTLYNVWSCCGHPRLYVPWFWYKICLLFEFWGQKVWKSCFPKIWVEFKYFWKTFKLILMHFILEISWFEWFLHKISIVFQKFHFSRFLINWSYFSIDQNCF